MSPGPVMARPAARTIRRATAALVVGVVVAGVVLGACTSPREALGTNASPCYQGLPVAADAVHHRGTFQGVRLLDLRHLAPDDKLRAALSVRTGYPVKSVCAFSYRGSYTLDQVERPLGPQPSGHGAPYAVVLVSTPQNKLLGTLVLNRQPMRFRHDVL